MLQKAGTKENKNESDVRNKARKNCHQKFSHANNERAWKWTLEHYIRVI